MIEIIEIKTPNCSHCKAIQPKLDEFLEKYKDDIKFEALTLGQDDRVKGYIQEFNIRSAPTFIVTHHNEFADIISEAIKFEELEDRIKFYLKKIG